MSGLEVTNIRKSYGKHEVLKGIDLSIGKGEILGLLGRNAQGKSTLGRLLVQLEKPDSGSIHFPTNLNEGEPSSPMLVPQDFVVWPHLTVETNVYYGTQGSKSKRKETTTLWLNKFDLYAVREQLAGTLSHGQQQRLALARAFAFHPSWIILDETFSHMDVLLRRELIEKTAEHCRAEKLSTLWITHDAEEAFAVADRVAVLEGGEIVQFDTPAQLYQHPKNAFVARLTGRGTLLNHDEWEKLVSLLGSTFDPKEEGTSQCARFLRPEHLIIRAVDQADLSTRFQVLSRQYAGDRHLYKIACESLPDLLVYGDSKPDPMEPGTSLSIELSANPCLLTDLYE